MQLSDSGLRLIERFEGFKPTAYRDVRGIWTIGYGHTAGVKEGDKCTFAAAQEMLRADAQIAADAVNKFARVPLTQNQFDALVSLTFNIGAEAFEESTLLRLLNDSEYAAASEQFLQWRRAGNDKSALLPRRSQERTLFDTP